MKEQKHTTLIDHGYVIVDLHERRLHLHTFSGNRKDAWDKFCRPEMRASWRKNGMQCVFVTLTSSFWFKPLPEDAR